MRALKPQGGRSDGQRPAEALADLGRRRKMLLELCYAGQISGELFGEQEREIAEAIGAVRMRAGRERAEEFEKDEIARRYAELVTTLRDLDIDRLWSAATDHERRTLVEELIERVEVHPDHLEVIIFGAPRLNVSLDEAGLGNQSQNVGVGGGTRSFCNQALAAGYLNARSDSDRHFCHATAPPTGGALCDTFGNAGRRVWHEPRDGS